MTELNLVPYEIKEKRMKRFMNKQYISYVIIALAVLFIGVYIPRLYLEKLNKDEINLDAKISTFSKVLSDNKSITEEMASYKAYNDKVDLLVKNKSITSTKVKDLQKFIPKDVILSEVNLASGIFTIKGTTLNYNSVSVFGANLQMAEEYKGARILDIKNIAPLNAQTQGNYEFTISIDMNNK